MSYDVPDTECSRGLRSVQAYLLGMLDLDSVQALQRRLAYEVTGDPTCAAVVLCEHPTGVTIGREGSRAHIHLSPEQLQARRWPVQWIARGGGMILHVPGQIACYPILPLDCLTLTPASYVSALSKVVGELLGSFGVKAEVGPTSVRVNGRRIAHFGAVVRNWVTSFGFVLNVSPDLELFRNFACDGDTVPDTSLQRECPIRVRIPTVRQRLLELLARRFEFGRLSVFHNHPTFLPRTPLHALSARHR